MSAWLAFTVVCTAVGVALGWCGGVAHATQRYRRTAREIMERHRAR